MAVWRNVEWQSEKCTLGFLCIAGFDPEPHETSYAHEPTIRPPPSLSGSPILWNFRRPKSSIRGETKKTGVFPVLGYLSWDLKRST